MLLAGFWMWQSSQRKTSHPDVDYSTAYGWIRAGKVKSVVMKGQSVTGTLSAPETVGGKQVNDFHTLAPAEDESLIPLLREKATTLRVESPEEPTAVRFLLTLLPWVLIIGVWVWL